MGIHALESNLNIFINKSLIITLTSKINNTGQLLNAVQQEIALFDGRLVEGILCIRAVGF